MVLIWDNSAVDINIVIVNNFLNLLGFWQHFFVKLFFKSICISRHNICSYNTIYMNTQLDRFTQDNTDNCSLIILISRDTVQQSTIMKYNDLFLSTSTETGLHSQLMVGTDFNDPQTSKYNYSRVHVQRLVIFSSLRTTFNDPQTSNTMTSIRVHVQRLVIFSSHSTQFIDPHVITQWTLYYEWIGWMGRWVPNQTQSAVLPIKGTQISKLYINMVLFLGYDLAVIAYNYDLIHFQI